MTVTHKCNDFLRFIRKKRTGKFKKKNNKTLMRQCKISRELKQDTELHFGIDQENAFAS